MSKSVTIPALICAYSRELEFQNVLLNSIRAGCSRIYVNIDGSDKSQVSRSQESMIGFVNQCRIRHPNVEIIARRSKSNLGASISVLSSLDWFFSKENFGLILEDDLEFDKSLFDYALWGTSQFEFDPDAWIISGSNFFSKNVQLKGEIHFPCYPVTWGWATWRHKWAIMREEILRSIDAKSVISLNPVSNFWSVGAIRSKSGLIDAWDIPLAEAMVRLEKFSVVAPANLVRNIGFSKLASNTKNQKFPINLPIEVPTNSFTSLPYRLDLRRSGPDVDGLYEKYVYRIKSRHALSVIISKFDIIRFRNFGKQSLRHRLESLTKEQFFSF